MKIFSAASAAFPGVTALVPNPPRYVAAPGLTNADFEAFAAYMASPAPLLLLTDGSTASVGSLKQAIYDNAIARLVDSDNKLPAGKTFKEAILAAYAGLPSADDKQQFALYFYMMLYHFSVWLCRWDTKHATWNNGGIRPVSLPLAMQTYLQTKLRLEAYPDGVKIKEDFYGTTYFTNACAINGTFAAMVDETAPNASRALGALLDPSGNQFRYLAAPNNITLGTAKKVRRKVVETFRSSVSGVIDSDVRRFLSDLARPTSADGKALLHGYINFQQFAVGDGTGTLAMFGEFSEGLIFFAYQMIDDKGGSKATIADINLLNRRDSADTAICFLYYGINKPFADATNGRNQKAPRVRLKKYKNKKELDTANEEALWCWDRSNYRPSARRALDPLAIKLSDFDDDEADALTCDLMSDVDPSPEEMVYIVFKHRVQHSGVTTTPSLVLDTYWELTDNQFRKTPQDEQALFAGQGQDLADLATALAADTGFEVCSLIEGLGVGSKIANPPAGACRLEREDDQSDKPPPDLLRYAYLRYAHGKMELYPRKGTSPPCLQFDTKGFVSPLRCTWVVGTNPPNQPNSLLTDIAPNLPGYIAPDQPDSQQSSPTYNCVLSAFRAFAMFEAMVKRVMDAVEADNSITPTVRAQISSALYGHRDNTASVKVLLPTRNPRFMGRVDPVTKVTLEVEHLFKRAEISGYN